MEKTKWWLRNKGDTVRSSEWYNRWYGLGSAQMDYLHFLSDVQRDDTAHYDSYTSLPPSFQEDQYDTALAGWRAYFESRLSAEEIMAVRGVSYSWYDLRDERLRAVDELQALTGVENYSPRSAYYKGRPEEWLSIYAPEPDQVISIPEGSDPETVAKVEKFAAEKEIRVETVKAPVEETGTVVSVRRAPVDENGDLVEPQARVVSGPRETPDLVGGDMLLAVGAVGALFVIVLLM